MTTQAPDRPDADAPTAKPLSDQAKAFKRYKQGVAEGGKPFFPYGVYHDVIAATVVIAIIIGLSVVWFAQANCDSWYDVNCGRAATPLEQEHYTPDDPGTVVMDEGKVDEHAKGPLLGPLYEDRADPASTKYHPRPEWYFYFLFYLLIVFSHPQLVLLGTIIVPTIFLVLLLAWPFLDRRKERRPSRRPVAMSAMVVTAVVLIAMTVLGSKAGEEEGPTGITAEQQEMPGFALIFEDDRATCQNCHVIGGSGQSVGPSLETIGADQPDLERRIEILAEGKGGMPARGGAEYTDEEVAQLAAFLQTMGAPDKATDPELLGVDAGTTEAVVGD